MKCGKGYKCINTQDSLVPDPNADAESAASSLEDVIAITPNVCLQKDMCQGCGRGDRYGLPLHFLFHYLNGPLRTVCFTCGKRIAGKTGLRLPGTESDIFAGESEADLRLIHIARQKMEAKK